ncbi:hypothetical protein GGR57DRAFT_508166 [Xylariaceae sp. FL1272]|nr:hypothetical protein GGR57DRAFT_508166 [Xylariaceae sp. FL1272]
MVDPAPCNTAQPFAAGETGVAPISEVFPVDHSPASMESSIDHTGIDLLNFTQAFNESMANGVTTNDADDLANSHVSGNHQALSPILNETSMGNDSPLLSTKSSIVPHLAQDTPIENNPYTFGSDAVNVYSNPSHYALDNMPGDESGSPNQTASSDMFGLGHTPANTNIDASFSFYQTAWELTALQLDSATSFVKIPRETYLTLGPVGAQYYKQRFLLTTGRAGDFFDDHMNPARIYLGAPADLQAKLRVAIKSVDERTLPCLVPLPARPQTNPEGAQQSRTIERETSALALGHGNYTSSSTLETTNSLPPAFPTPSATLQTATQGIRGPKPMNNFMFWSRTMRPTLKAQNPGVTNGQISKMLSNMWDELPIEEKAQQRALAEQANPEWARTHPIVNGKRTRASGGSGLPFAGSDDYQLSIDLGLQMLDGMPLQQSFNDSHYLNANIKASRQSRGPSGDLENDQFARNIATPMTAVMQNTTFIPSLLATRNSFITTQVMASQAIRRSITLGANARDFTMNARTPDPYTTLTFTMITRDEGLTNGDDLHINIQAKRPQLRLRARLATETSP